MISITITEGGSKTEDFVKKKPKYSGYQGAQVLKIDIERAHTLAENCGFTVGTTVYKLSYDGKSVVEGKIVGLIDKPDEAFFFGGKYSPDGLCFIQVELPNASHSTYPGYSATYTSKCCVNELSLTKELSKK